jgi:hypothetical protein
VEGEVGRGERKREEGREVKREMSEYLGRDIGKQ